MNPSRVTRYLVVGTCMAFMTACSTESTPVSRGAFEPSPIRTATPKPGLCQPFPDRVLDEFMTAYNDRDRDALTKLVTASPIEDVVASAYSGDESFASVEEWAEAGWSVGDRLRSAGYGAFHPTKDGFQMFLVRSSDALRTRGIESVATQLDAITEGCSITFLGMSGIVQARERPCAFYEEYADNSVVAANEPASCTDGSGDHAMTGHAAVWTGDDVLLWGGDRGGLFTYPDVIAHGFAFDPKERRWAQVPEVAGRPVRPEVHVWTGSELIVVGGTMHGRGVDAAAYNHADRSWRKLPSPLWLWGGFEGVWTGSELFIWGGPDHAADARRRGALFNPVTETWRPTAPAPVSGRWSHAIVWTGTEAIVWGGGNSNSDLADGAAYNPRTDTWRAIAPAPVTPRQWLPLVWTGREVIVWGGSSISRSRADGAAYDPALDRWRKLPPAPLERRHYHSAVWTGTEVIVFGGYDYDRSFRDGAAYDPIANSWRRIRSAPIARRCCHTALWTGSSMFVFGGVDDLGHMAHGDGAVYDPRSNRWIRLIPP